MYANHSKFFMGQRKKRSKRRERDSLINETRITERERRAESGERKVENP